MFPNKHFIYHIIKKYFIYHTHKGIFFLLFLIIFILYLFSHRPVCIDNYRHIIFTLLFLCSFLFIY